MIQKTEAEDAVKESGSFALVLSAVSSWFAVGSMSSIVSIVLFYPGAGAVLPIGLACDPLFRFKSPCGA